MKSTAVIVMPLYKRLHIIIIFRIIIFWSLHLNHFKVDNLDLELDDILVIFE